MAKTLQHLEQCPRTTSQWVLLRKGNGENQRPYERGLALLPGESLWLVVDLIREDHSHRLLRTAILVAVHKYIGSCAALWYFSDG